MSDLSDLENRFGEAQATICAIGILLWGRSDHCDDLNNDEAIKIGRALSSAADRVDKIFYELLKTKMKEGQS